MSKELTASRCRSARRTQVAILWFLLAVGIGSSEAQEAVGASIDSFLEGRRGETATLRKRVARNCQWYLDTPGGSTWTYGDERWYLYQDHEAVVISNVGELGGDGYWVEYRDEVAGRQRIDFNLPSDPATRAVALSKMWACVFVPSDESSYDYYLEDKRSRLLHLSHCNHVAAGAVLVGRETLVGCDSLVQCPFCFRKTPLLQDYELERELGTRAEMEYRATHRPSADAEMLRRVEGAGERVLSHWPLPLRGYDYAFMVSESPVPGACALPGGAIAISSGLLKALEDDDELEAVLAHEIAHVELRHGLEQFRATNRSAKWAAVAGVLVGGVVAASSDDPMMREFALGMTGAVSVAAILIAAAGYAEEQQLEADDLACVYLASTGRSERLLGRVIRGTCFYADAQMCGIGDGRFIAERLACVGTREVRLCSERAGVDGEGELEVQWVAAVNRRWPRLVEMDGVLGETVTQTVQMEHCMLVACGHAERSLGGKRAVDGLQVLLVGPSGTERSVSFDDPRDTVIFPCQDVAMVFEARTLLRPEERVAQAKRVRGFQETSEQEW